MKNVSYNAQQLEQYSLKKETALEKALEDLKKDSEVNDTWRRNLQIAVINIYLKRYPEAEAFIEKALARNNGLAETSVINMLEVLKNCEYASLSDEAVYNIWRL